VSSICGECGGGVGKAVAKSQAAAPALNVAGYDWGSNGTAEADKKESAPIAKHSTADLAQIATTPDVDIPAEPPKPVPTSPITVATLQGEWVNSVGAKIKVSGTEVSLNGMVMKVHPVTVDDDGLVVSIGKIWQLKGWQAEDQIEFKEAPSREVMEFARSVVWTKASEEKMKEWNKQMEGLGYAGSASNPMSRGIEGCCPGTSDAAAKVVADDKERDKAELTLLNRLISEYRLPGTANIPPRKVIPDFSNRGHTGLSVEHVHYLATSFKEKGFQKRVNDQGHDIPVLVKQPVNSDLGQKSIENWRAKLADEPGFPPKEHYEKLFRESEIYTSLGNGHFNQALNLFATETPSIYSQAPYTIGTDADLKEAVYTGVTAIVLSADIPLRDREIVSKLLNSKREFKWSVSSDGTLHILDAAEDTTTCKQFEAMSKVLDAVELNCLVRAELGVTDSHRIGQ